VWFGWVGFFTQQHQHNIPEDLNCWYLEQCHNIMPEFKGSDGVLKFGVVIGLNAGCVRYLLHRTWNNVIVCNFRFALYVLAITNEWL
jgi:hypothetical protein